MGDCNANYYPRLTVDANPIRFTAIAGGATFELPGYIRVVNDGGGLMPWTATVRYTDGNGWAFLSAASGLGTASVRVTADPKGLAPGTYKASVFIDAGSRAGNGSVPVTLVVSPAADGSHAAAPAARPDAAGNSLEDSQRGDVRADPAGGGFARHGDGDQPRGQERLR